MRVSKKSIAHLLPPESVEILPPGTVVCEGFISGRPVPWKAPRVNRSGGSIGGRDYSRYTSWKTEIGLKASGLRTRQCYAGEVTLDVIFFLLYIKGQSVPDRSNLLKCYEDSIQGILIRNDTQIWGGNSTRVILPNVVEGIKFKIVAMPSPVLRITEANP